MGSLFDELKKAKLIDKKKEKQLRHEQRVDKRSAQDRDDEGAQKQQAFEQRRQERKQQDRAKGKEAQEASRQRARWAELRQLVAARQLPAENGRRRWHFIAPNGRLPFFEVGDGTGKRLEAGELAILRDPNVSWPSYVIVPREVGLRMREMKPELVCYLKGAGA